MDIYVLLPSNLLFADVEKSPAPLIRDLCQELEGAGFAGLVGGDHIVHMGHPSHDKTAFPAHADVFLLLTYAAAVTTRVRLATRIVVVPYRQPFATAHAIATLDVFSGGRVDFGGASGYAEVEFQAFGVPMKQRGSRTDEYLRIMTALWEQEKISFQGRYYSVNEVGLLMRPLQKPRPPIWIGGFSHRAVQRAVEFGDAWTPNCSEAYSPDKTEPVRGMSRRELVEETDWANSERARLGRPPLGLVLSSGPNLEVTEKPAHPGRKRDEIQYFSGRGTPDELTDEYRAFKEAGATAFYVTVTGASVPEYLRNARAFMREVVPALL